MFAIKSTRHFWFSFAALSTASLMLSACVSTANIKKVQDRELIPVKAGTTTKPVQFRKIVIKLKRGTDIGSIQLGLLCVPRRKLTYRGGRNTLSGDELTEVFQEELRANNYTVVGDPDALFEDPSAWKAEFLIAGLVKSMQANICYPFSGLGDSGSAKGEASMTVDWQVYSRLGRKVVYKVSTGGYGEITNSRPGGFIDVFLDAFAQATRHLLADQGFHDLITGKKALPQAKKTESAITIASRSLSGNPIDTHINEIRIGVATVFAGDGHGTGFFIGDDGYLLTNEHVVREAKFVKIKIVTGREILGEVVRTNAVRDIALVKAEETSIKGLPIRLEAPDVGSPVFVMGSPLDPDFSSTLSRGIISAYRSKDGQEYIQSDANVLPGSSGGPLLDDRGNVLGVTVEGIIMGMAGLNFFIPIRDALDKLSIKVQQSDGS